MSKRRFKSFNVNLAGDTSHANTGNIKKRIKQISEYNQTEHFYKDLAATKQVELEDSLKEINELQKNVELLEKNLNSSKNIWKEILENECKEKFELEYENLKLENENEELKKENNDLDNDAERYGETSKKSDETMNIVETVPVKQTDNFYKNLKTTTKDVEDSLKERYKLQQSVDWLEKNLNSSKIIWTEIFEKKFKENQKLENKNEELLDENQTLKSSNDKLWKENYYLEEENQRFEGYAESHRITESS